MVKFFNTVMAFVARISFVAIFISGYVPTNFGTVSAKWAASIFSELMEKEAILRIVSLSELT